MEYIIILGWLLLGLGGSWAWMQEVGEINGAEILLHLLFAPVYGTLSLLSMIKFNKN